MSADESPRVWLACRYEITRQSRYPEVPLVLYRKHKLCLVFSEGPGASVVTLTLDGSKYHIKNFSHKELDYKYVEQHAGVYLHVLGVVHTDGSIEMLEGNPIIPTIAGMNLQKYKNLLNGFEVAKHLVDNPTWLGNTLLLVGNLKKRCKFPGDPGKALMQPQ